LNECQPGIAEEVLNVFNQLWQNTQLNVYLASISEHDRNEDFHGRLSMWRAFGDGTGARVALVFKLPMLVQADPVLPLILGKVGYFNDQQLANELDTVINNIRNNREFLGNLPRQTLIGSTFGMLLTHVVTLKHEGFHEEKEWRIIYFPTLMPSDHIESSIQVVGGIPQRVYEIPLENNAAAGIALGVVDLLDRVIIGPSQFPIAMYDAFVEELNKAGVRDTRSRVFASQIPVRT
jgi:hypothetical protein